MIYAKVTSTADSSELVTSVFDTMDQANSWIAALAISQRFGHSDIPATPDIVVTPGVAAVPAQAEVLNDDGSVKTPAVAAQDAIPAVIIPGTPAIPSQYAVTITDDTAAQAQAKINADSYAYLKSTDWYVVRQLDNGTEMPADVKAKRQAARDAIK